MISNNAFSTYQLSLITDSLMPAPPRLAIGLILAIMAFALDRPVFAAEPHPNVLLIVSDDQASATLVSTATSWCRLQILTGWRASPPCFGISSWPRLALRRGPPSTRAATTYSPACGACRRGPTCVATKRSCRRSSKRQAIAHCMLARKTASASTSRCPGSAGWDNSIGGGGGYTHRDTTISQKSGNTAVKGWTANIWTDHAIQFIRGQHDGPWFASVAYIIPHMPWVCPEKYSAFCGSRLLRRPGCLLWFDRGDRRCIGRLLARAARNRAGTAHGSWPS